MRSARSLLAEGSIVIVSSLAFGACSELKPSDPQAASKARAAAKRQQAACGSAIAYERLKGLIFDEALRESGNRARLDALADYSFVRMENPVVKGWDPALEVTRCRGHIVLEMPAGVRRAFDGERRLQADVDYTAQAAADGSGHVYSLRGAEPITARLATFNLADRAYQPPPAIDQRADEAGELPPVEIAQVAESSSLPRALPADETPVIKAKAIPPDREGPAKPDRVMAQAEREKVPAIAANDAGETVVRGFYDALGTGDGVAASARIVPEKREGRAFSPEAISRFYGRLPEPLRLVEVVPLANNTFRVKYRYSAGRSKCNGTAVVKLVNREGEKLIRAIDAKNGC